MGDWTGNRMRPMILQNGPGPTGADGTEMDGTAGGRPDSPSGGETPADRGPKPRSHRGSRPLGHKNECLNSAREKILMLKKIYKLP